MVCSCVVPCKLVWLQIIFCSCVIGTTFSREKLHITSLSCQEVIKIGKQTWWWSNDKTIIKLGYRKISWFVSVSQINYLPQPPASQIIELLATDKSRHFAQLRPVIVNYLINWWRFLVISSRDYAFYMQVNYFHPLTFRMTVPLFTEKFYRVKGRLFQQNLIFDHLYLLKTKSRKRSKLDNFNLHRKRSFIDQYTENSPPIDRFTKI